MKEKKELDLKFEAFKLNVIRIKRVRTRNLEPNLNTNNPTQQIMTRSPSLFTPLLFTGTVHHLLFIGAFFVVIVEKMMIKA